MRVAHLRIAPLTPTTTIDPSVLRDLLLTDPEGRVEHIRIRAGPDGTDILAFVDSDSAEAAIDVLRRLVNKRIATTGPLHSWRII